MIKICRKFNIHPLRTHTNYIPHPYLHNYSYMQYFYTNFTTFSNLILSITHTSIKTPHLENIQSSTSHRDTKNMRNDLYIHYHNTFITFLEQKKIASHPQKSQPKKIQIRPVLK